MPGTVLTFYSYKGGVGRSFALANIAVLLARWGHRVLCLDWDLEAPGLHHYFRPMLGQPVQGGVVDLVEDFRSGRLRPGAHAIRVTDAGALDLIPAGADGPDYVSRVQGLDWDELYDDGFGEYLEQCRERWIADYDYVLLDSRTGVSDIGGICTAHLPDRLVVLFTANEQSVRGAVDIAERANVARDRLPFDRPQLTVLPVLSRFDSREEYDRAEEWRGRCFEQAKGLFHNWLHRSVPVETMARHLTLPYVSYWSFGEQLPVRQEENPASDQISFALETVAAVVARHFDRTDLLAENRDAYVAAVRDSRRDFPVDVRVSTPRSTLDEADALIDSLKERGVRAERSLSGDPSLLAHVNDDARHLCLIVDRAVSRWQSAEAELFLHRSFGQDRRVIPVLTADADAQALPGPVRNLRYLRLGLTRGPAEVAREIAGQLGRTSLTDNGDLDLVGALRQAAGARLRPLLWELVDETVRALVAAVEAGDDAQAQDLAADLALALRPRATPGEEHLRVPAPRDTGEQIEQGLRLLSGRGNHHSGRDFR
ncbi:MinD-like ATPase involved in chromosome partitioning or flagellar assembly [Amycolatopsis bartoniae]|uniref:CobQ/CobB/MinD/ParA nucleotide binding domain-containing protein n=1 Tax=Amycolatopsis bartoniae TaxID=941986 RepID=A0A8H9IUM0_9PSEU|nr:CATRA system-associated protein [Amycolatopsis bartoniae]MBB2936745.1 MinD-like ATPase involved in chromosome partitioning or flagellar assembly [Amycolatopsis bartoniae]TVT09203.1 CpsD/CapB family tyrosine-protein kinase [Amycolatopsis bartoniae]GHF49844.1 hypothetical protein GCM10017566_23590 [Amycolatopsis bartoniae]